jgi:hypothetical protein
MFCQFKLWLVAVRNSVLVAPVELPQSDCCIAFPFLALPFASQNQLICALTKRRCKVLCTWAVFQCQTT